MNRARTRPYDTSLMVGGRSVAADQPTYFVADLAANHDGDVSRAKDLIWKAKEAGADAAKFQHFLAREIVSRKGFEDLGGQVSHQSSWKKSVYEIYEDYECERSWSDALIETCKDAGIDFMTTPYDREATERFAPHVAAIKIGSGDVTWTETIEHIAAQGKPVLLAVGASSMEDVKRAVSAALKHNRQLCLMQCNTNYTGSSDNFKYINLNTLKTFESRWPGMVLGLSDHTPGHAAVLGAVAIGARVVEKHFTDDNSREGPDHPFSMDPRSWREMIERARELELALGDGVKRVEENEKETVVVQRRCLRLARDLVAGTTLTREHLDVLRPAPEGALQPWEIDEVLGRRIKRDMLFGADLKPEDLE